MFLFNDYFETVVVINSRKDIKKRRENKEGQCETLTLKTRFTVVFSISTPRRALQWRMPKREILSANGLCHSPFVLQNTYLE